MKLKGNRDKKEDTKNRAGGEWAFLTLSTDFRHEWGWYVGETGKKPLYLE